MDITAALAAHDILRTLACIVTVLVIVAPMTLGPFIYGHIHDGGSFPWLHEDDADR